AAADGGGRGAAWSAEDGGDGAAGGSVGDPRGDAAELQPLQDPAAAEPRHARCPRRLIELIAAAWQRRFSRDPDPAQSTSGGSKPGGFRTIRSQGRRSSVCSAVLPTKIRCRPLRETAPMT